jgi:hypothetical protein
MAGGAVIGDGWGNTWADDDKIYTMHNDTSIWNDISTATATNVKISTLSSSATDGSAVGTLVSNMTRWGTMTQNTGSPARSHKVNSVIAIGTTFYGLSWRLDPNWAMGVVGTWDGQLIKSTDHGASWTPQPPSDGAPYSTAAMWPGTTFPFGCVQYGKAYAGSGPHGSGTYVYSTIIVGATTDKLKLARVPLATIGNMSVADWQYWTGGDGMNPANWSSTRLRPRTRSSSFRGAFRGCSICRATIAISTGGRAGFALTFAPHRGIAIRT